MNHKRYKVLIPAAGEGKRTGLSFPKTLFPVEGVPIIVIILRNTQWLDEQPVVIVSPKGKQLIRETLSEYGLSAELVCQRTPKGMGDAVLHFEKSVFSQSCEGVLLIWGDMFSVKERTLRKLVQLYEENGVDFAFPSVLRYKPYIYIERDQRGRITDVRERREGDMVPDFGETDTGVFFFNKEKVFSVMRDNTENLRGKITQEINFIPVISELTRKGFEVGGYQIASQTESIGFNTFSDIEKAVEISGRIEALRQNRYPKRVQE